MSVKSDQAEYLMDEPVRFLVCTTCSFRDIHVHTTVVRIKMLEIDTNKFL